MLAKNFQEIENPLISGSETKTYLKSKKAKEKAEERIVGEMFSCQKCGSSFANVQNLSRHKRIKHENVRFKCDQCDYEATRREHLKTHSEGKHGGVKYLCDQCEYQAVWLNGIRQHNKNRHSHQFTMQVFDCQIVDPSVFIQQQ